MESCLIINRPGEKEGGMEVPTRSSGALAFLNLSHTSTPAVNVKVSIFSYLEFNGDQLDRILN